MNPDAPRPPRNPELDEWSISPTACWRQRPARVSVCQPSRIVRSSFALLPTRASSPAWTRMPETSGCSCEVAGPGGHGLALLLLGVGLVLVVRRRRQER